MEAATNLIKKAEAAVIVSTSLQHLDKPDPLEYTLKGTQISKELFQSYLDLGLILKDTASTIVDCLRSTKEIPFKSLPKNERQNIMGIKEKLLGVLEEAPNKNETEVQSLINLINSSVMDFINPSKKLKQPEVNARKRSYNFTHHIEESFEELNDPEVYVTALEIAMASRDDREFVTTDSIELNDLIKSLKKGEYGFLYESFGKDRNKWIKHFKDIQSKLEQIGIKLKKKSVKVGQKNRTKFHVAWITPPLKKSEKYVLKRQGKKNPDDVQIIYPDSPVYKEIIGELGVPAENQVVVLKKSPTGENQPRLVYFGKLRLTKKVDEEEEEEEENAPLVSQIEKIHANNLSTETVYSLPKNLPGSYSGLNGQKVKIADPENPDHALLTKEIYFSNTLISQTSANMEIVVITNFNNPKKQLLASKIAIEFLIPKEKELPPPPDDDIPDGHIFFKVRSTGPQDLKGKIITRVVERSAKIYENCVEETGRKPNKYEILALVRNGKDFEPITIKRIHLTKSKPPNPSDFQ